MRYTVFLEPTAEADQPGWYYARIPALDLTTHGLGVDGALATARDLADLWLQELADQGVAPPRDTTALIGHVEAGVDAVQRP